MKNINKESGQAVLLVMMMVLLLFLLSGAVLVTAGENRRAYHGEMSMVAAYYIAEAGVERVLAQIMTDRDWLWDVVHGATAGEVVFIADEAYAGGEIAKVTVREIGIEPGLPLDPAEVIHTDIEILSEGSYQGSRKTLVVKVRITSPLRFSAPFWVNQLETAPGHVELTGDKPVPVLDRSFFWKNKDQHHEGDLYLSGELPVAGILYVSGDLYLAGEYTGAGIIVVEGRTYITGDLVRSPPFINSCLLVITFGAGGIDMTANTIIWGLMYATPGSGSGQIKLGEGVQFRGALIGDRLAADLFGGTQIHYDSQMAANRPGWATTGIVITSWQELHPVF